MTVDYNAFWPGFEKATCVDAGCWCEAPRIGSWILEPVNTWSNLAFIFFGVFILHRAFIKRDPAHLLYSPTITSVYGMALVFLGLGSGFFHASRTNVGMVVDVLGMYVITLFYLLFNFIRSKHLGQRSFLLLYLPLVAVSAGYIYTVGEFGKYAGFGIQLAITFVHCLYIQRSLGHKVEMKYFWGASAVFVLAFTAWNLDRSRLVCFPWAPLNGHGIWHVLNGYAAYLVYRFYASDKSEHLSFKFKN